MNELKDHVHRAHALLSASSSARWLACPPSAVAAATYPNKSTVFTREGTVAHEVAEARLLGKDIAVSENLEITAEMIRCGDDYADYVNEQVTDPNAVVLTEQRLDFSPWVPQGFGTGDCLIMQGTTLHVIDYKYGKGVEVSAVENPQMRLYALGALNDFGLIYDVQTIKTHIFQPRINNISTEEITVDELRAWGDKIKPIAEMASRGEGKHKAGDHCRFCPHAGACPELARQAAKVFEDAGEEIAVPTLAPVHVAEILQATPMLTHWLKAVQDRALSDMMNGQEIPGYKLVEGRLGNRKWKEECQVIGILRGEGYGLNEFTETVLLSPAKMDKALGKDKVAELLADQIDRAPGAPTIAPASDKRKPYDRLAEAQNDFKN